MLNAELKTSTILGLLLLLAASLAWKLAAPSVPVLAAGEHLHFSVEGGNFYVYDDASGQVTEYNSLGTKVKALHLQ